jgi:hypothetical protein
VVLSDLLVGYLAHAFSDVLGGQGNHAEPPVGVTNLRSAAPVEGAEVSVPMTVRRIDHLDIPTHRAHAAQCDPSTLHSMIRPVPPDVELIPA